MFHTRTWRTGSARGAASVNRRRLACDHRLVAASHRASERRQTLSQPWPTCQSLAPSHRTRFGRVGRDSYRICCVAPKPAKTCPTGFDSDLRRRATHSRQSRAPSKPSVSAAAFFGSESPLNPTVARSSSSSLGLPALASSSAHCSTFDYRRVCLRARPETLGRASRLRAPLGSFLRLAPGLIQFHEPLLGEF